MELSIISFFQNNFFQWIIYILSYGGHLFVIFGFASVAYIAVNKELGGKALIFYFTSMLTNAYLKEWIGRPRPYQAGATEIIENSRQPSMPSGHTQGTASVVVAAGQHFKNKKQAYFWGVLFLLFICFTRVYLGQHYLSDVIVGAVIGLAIGAALEVLYYFTKERATLYLLGLVPVAITLMIIFPDYRDAFVSAGILVGALAGINLEKKFANYKVSGSLPNRIVKVLFTMLVSSILMTPFTILYMFDVIYPNLGIFFMFLMLTLGITFLSPFLMTKLSFFDTVFNSKKAAITAE